MAQVILTEQNLATRKKVTIDLWAVFITYSVVMFFINAVNIGQCKIVAELMG